MTRSFEAFLSSAYRVSHDPLYATLFQMGSLKPYEVSVKSYSFSFPNRFPLPSRAGAPG
jgi:hypothetical protein